MKIQKSDLVFAALIAALIFFIAYSAATWRCDSHAKATHDLIQLAFESGKSGRCQTCLDEIASATPATITFHTKGKCEVKE